MNTRVILFALLACIMASCIKNDLPYPRIQANFTSFSLQGESSPCVIDSANRVIMATLAEDADIYNVTVANYTLTPGARVDSAMLATPLDLSKPCAVEVSLYQDYWWVIKATQPIERYFNVAGQMGESYIDPVAARVIVTLPSSVKLDQLKVMSMKLGATGSTTLPDLSGSTIDLTRPIEVDVTTHGHTVRWTIMADVVESTVFTLRADAWTRVAWVYGEAVEGRDNGIEYRRSDQQEWTRVPSEWLTVNGGSFCARIPHLQPQTEYAARAYSDQEYAPEVVFTTGIDRQLPNSDFENWWLYDNKVWNPWKEGGEPFWDTGNKGAATLGQSNSVPTFDTPSGKGRAAMLETKFVGVGSLGKLAAGNIFLGYFVRTDGTNGILSFGRPFTQRPTKIKGYLKYKCAPISHSSAEYKHLIGRPDTCTVWAALIDTDEPFEIRTNPKNLSLFNPSGDYVIAYGNIMYGHDVDKYIKFEFDLKYNDTSRTPTYLILAASASKYGDYFTGGVGSILWVDDIELEYDY